MGSFTGEPEPKDTLKSYIKRDVKMPSKRVSLSIGSPLGNLEGIRLPGLFERRGWYTWDPFLNPEDTKMFNLGTIWNLVNGQGSPELIDYGVQKARI